jgi:hypothetical protein
MPSPAITQKLTVLTQDPGVRINGRLALSQVEVPAERLDIGPTGYRVRVIDFDATGNVLYKGPEYGIDASGVVIDPFQPPATANARAWRAYERRLLADPRFHAQNAYAIAMRTLATFERALGRRVEWGFRGQQLQIAPHAFADANAFYSEVDQALMFGYFKGKRGATVFTSLSHDIVAHETTHALLDGMRDAFTDASLPDQAGFHEGFADVVALLSVFSLRETTKACLMAAGARRRATRGGQVLIPGSMVERDKLAASLLLGLGEQFGRELREIRGDALRRSVELKPSRARLELADWEEPHLRGEVFSAAMLNAFLDLWVARIAELGTFGGGQRSLDAVVDEGSKVAAHLLTVAIRALDYCPAVDLSFSAYLASLLTADAEVAPDDSRYEYRKTIRKAFTRYGIVPPKTNVDPTTGYWEQWQGDLTYSRAHFESMLRDCEEVFRFVWENRQQFGIDGRGFTRVNFVRPAMRVGPDGLVLRETIAEYWQVARIFGSEVTAVLGCDRPQGMSSRQAITAYGGGTLVFDQYGRVKYHISHPLFDPERQGARLEFLWRTGYFERSQQVRSRFSAIHRNRAFS